MRCLNIPARSFHLFALLSGGISAFAQSTSSAAELWPLQSFRSTPIKAPFMNVTKNGKTELGYLFISPMDTIRNTGYPMIYADDGQIIWQGPMANTSAYQHQMLDGEPVLAFWSGADFSGFGFGSISILNSCYQEIYTVVLPGDEEKFVTIYEPETFQSNIDIHESQITNQGTILVMAVNVTQADLTPIGGFKHGWVQDSMFYEIDIKRMRFFSASAPSSIYTYSSFE